MKTYVFNELTSAQLAEIATIHHEPSVPGFWENLARKELLESDRTALGLLTARLRYYKSQRVNEATPRSGRGPSTRS